MGRADGASMFMTLLRLSRCCLMRYTGHEDFGLAHRSRTVAAAIPSSSSLLPQYAGDAREIRRRAHVPRGAATGPADWLDSYEHQELPIKNWWKNCRRTATSAATLWFKSCSLGVKR